MKFCMVGSDEMRDLSGYGNRNAKKCCAEINKRLERLNIDMKFNMYHFSLFCKYYRIKENTKLCYITKIYSQPQYGYSLQTIDFIVEEVKKDPENIIQNLKKKTS